MRPLAFVIAALLLASCGSTAGPSSSPQPSARSAASSPSPVPTGTLPGSAIRITVNGVPYQQGAELTLTPTGGPVVIEMAFPFAVDRLALERFLPKTTAPLAWIDDRTVRLTYPEGEPNLSFKAVQVPSADGKAWIDMFSVHIAFPATRVIDLFTVSELHAIKTTGVRTAAASYRVSVADGLTVSPDGRRAITFDAIGPPSDAAALAMIDLATRKITSLAQPPQTDGPFAFADWLPDGRLLIVGRNVWIGDGEGASMRRVADAGSAVGNLPWTAVPSPNGDRVAIWAYNADGHIAIVDLRDGSVVRVAGPFRRSAADARVSLAWSPDGALLAGTDNDAETGVAPARVRIVDLASDRTIRTIEGGVIQVSAFPTGELMVMRDVGEQGAGSRDLGQLVGFDGVEHRRYMGCGWVMSPDLRFILQRECGGAGFIGHTLIDVSTGTAYGFGTPSAFERWLADGRLAFY